MVDILVLGEIVMWDVRESLSQHHQVLDDQTLVARYVIFGFITDRLILIQLSGAPPMPTMTVTAAE